MKVQPEAAYSNARIVNTIQRVVRDNYCKKINQNAILCSIKELGPDLSKNMLPIFEKQLEYVKRVH